MNLMTSSVTSRLIGIKLLKRMIKVRKFNPKFAAPPSEAVQKQITEKKKIQKGRRGNNNKTSSQR